MLNGDGLGQWWRKDWTGPPWGPIWPGGGGRSVTEDELIDDEIKHGLSVDQVTDKVLWNRHPEFRDCRLPRSCQELTQLQREWARIRVKIETRQGRGGRTNVPWSS